MGLVHQKESIESSAGPSALAFNAIILLIVKTLPFQEQTSYHDYKKIQLGFDLCLFVGVGRGQLCSYSLKGHQIFVFGPSSSTCSTDQHQQP